MKLKFLLWIAAAVAAVVAGVFFPKSCIFRNMEAANISLVELLHLCNALQAIIIVAHTLVPLEGSALFHCRGNVICLNDIIGNLRHVSSQDALVDAGEAFAIQKILYLQAVEFLLKRQLLFHSTSNLI